MNPNYQQVNAINPGNPQNEANPRVMRTHNTFPMSYQHALTCRFGDETPFFVFDSEANDKVPFSSFHELRSYTLSSQFLDKLNMHKTYFSVPYKAIMPNTWDLFYIPPTQGDDVPKDVAPFFSNPLSLFSDITDTFNSTFVGSHINNNNFTNLIKSYILFELFFSDASLLSLMGCKLNKYFRYYDKPFSFENFSNDFMSFILKVLNEIELDSLTVSWNQGENRVLIDLENDNKPYLLRQMLETCREHPDFQINLPDNFESSSTFDIDFHIDSDANIPINISRCCAYQLAYFHYLTNDKVDFIYSADLYRNTMLGLAKDLVGSIQSFTLNGNTYFYDWCSGAYLDVTLNNFFDFSLDFSNHYVNASYIYLCELLSIRKSLKYGDYFTGSRPRPYAVGDMTAPVVGNGVSAVDMTRNIMAQRFLNAVNKTGRKISDYLKGIRGANTMPLLTDPKFLARDTTTIGTMEVENTAGDQGNVVSLLRAEQSKYAFEADIEDPCIIIGVVSFSTPRMYSRTIDRFFFKTEREDYFNPYFQNIGDQEIYMAEKGQGGLTPFAYTLRHMEYKQRYPIASAGAVEYLPSWFMIADNEDSEPYLNISPEFIRSSNVEFDRFYKSLNGTTLSSYFHFIIRFVNESNPNRNMEYSPTIL